MQRRSGIARLPLSVMARKATTKTDSTAALGFEAKLWLAADDLRNNMDAAEYKHVVLGLTPRLAIMNLALRGIEADFGKENADTFRNVQHPDLRADYVLANGSMSFNRPVRAHLHWLRTLPPC
jgi:type I restriction-modification system DNA methylase subunit